MNVSIKFMWRGERPRRAGKDNCVFKITSKVKAAKEESNKRVNCSSDVRTNEAAVL